jgi:membrane associated rhomboid family serine protease
MNPASGRFSPVVLVLLGACLLLYLLQMSGEQFLLTYLALWPPGPRTLQYTAHGAWQYPDFQIWQLVTYAFLHGGATHLLFNMFGLWMFGTPVERALGSRRFVMFYLVCILGAAGAQILVAQWSGHIVPTIGASGGVLGLLPAFAILFPKARVQLLFPPVNLRAPVFVLLYGAAEIFFGVTGTLPGIAHFAHLGGMLSGGALLAVWLLRRKRD